MTFAVFEDFPNLCIRSYQLNGCILLSMRAIVQGLCLRLVELIILLLVFSLKTLSSHQVCYHYLALGVNFQTVFGHHFDQLKWQVA